MMHKSRCQKDNGNQPTPDSHEVCSVYLFEVEVTNRNSRVTGILKLKKDSVGQKYTNSRCWRSINIGML